MQEAKLKERKKVRERKVEEKGEKEETVRVEGGKAKERGEEAEKEAELPKLPPNTFLKGGRIQRNKGEILNISY